MAIKSSYSVLRRRVLRRAAVLGATVRIVGGEVCVEAPRGHVWSDGDYIHELVCSPFDEETIVDMLSLALDRMSVGVEPCPHEACDWCRS